MLYDLSVGFERLLKIAVVLLEHEEAADDDALEKSLITHNHLELLKRVGRCTRVGLASPHKEFLGLLGTFYKSLRYDRFTLASVYDPKKERVLFVSSWASISKWTSKTPLRSSGHPMIQDTVSFSVRL